MTTTKFTDAAYAILNRDALLDAFPSCAFCTFRSAVREHESDTP